MGQLEVYSRFSRNCIIIYVIEPFEILRKAVLSVLTDRGFDLTSERTQGARLCTEKLLEWMTENKDVSADFATNVISSLETCCRHPRTVTYRTMKEHMWEKYYKLCSSDSFRCLWTSFLEKSIGCHSDPIFFQFVTTVIMDSVIKDQFQVQPTCADRSDFVASLDFEESNALHYTAGYVIRSLSKKLRRSAHLLKDELILCLEEINEGESFNFHTVHVHTATQLFLL